MTAVVYSVTKSHVAGEAFEQALPFQLAVIELPDHSRTTVRIVGLPVQIGDHVAPDPGQPGCWRLASPSR